MRIALVVHEYGRTFGHSRYVVELAERFRAEHEVHVFANRVDAGDTAGLHLHHVPAVRQSALSTILTFAPVATAMVGSGFDVVHAQGLSTLRCNVVTAHLCLAAWFAARREEAIGDDWKQRVFEGVVTPLERSFYRATRDAWTIAISDATRNDLARHYGRSEQVEVIHHGVDLETFSPATRAAHRAEARRELGLADGQFAALYVGDLRRGAPTALETVARTPGARLVLVSRSDPAPYRAHADTLGLGTRAIFRPATDRIERAYAAADAFLFPTPYDAFGMVIVEAMACGLPVITTRRAGAAELVKDGESGFLVDTPQDVAGLARHLRSIVADETTRHRVGTVARQRMERQSWDDVARRTMGVYERAARRAPSQHGR